jgi:NAD(P)-dependent dehydrogenase (short-subunit alcohol dehydrogenase family)
MSTVSLVTGGNRGIGREVCRQLAELGHVVLLTARSADAAAAAARAVHAESLPLDVTDPAASLASMGGGTPAYTASKVALNALTRMLAAELRRDHVLVNAVCPGWVATDMGGPGGRPVEAGAASVVWAATLPDSGPTGGFFRDGHPFPW